MGLHTVLIYILSYLAIFVTVFYILNMRDYTKGKKIPFEATDKTVSIIIPAYNEEASIEKTIESALALDYPEDKLEIIVIDDGSEDNTYALAKKYTSSRGIRVRVFTQKNGGKGTALNHGISKSKMDIILTMDADTFAEPHTLKRMIARFYDDTIYSVTPAMGIYKPKSFFQRIQHIEYYIGVFLRKAFASVDAIHVTPGAFSAYRRSFFVKHGGYEVGNITEDLEMALRIQQKGYSLENAPEAPVYTIAPKTFREILIQRKRWYVGWIRNFWRKRELFGFKKGVLGTIVLPMAFISIFLAVVLTIYSTIKIFLEVNKEVSFMNSINFEFNGAFELGSYLSQEVFIRLFYSLFSKPVFLIVIFSLSLTIFYLMYSKKKMQFQERVFFNAIIFVVFYSFFYTFWWILATFYCIFNKEVVWRKEDGKKI